MTLEVALVPCLTDNYAVLLHDNSTNETLCVDAPDPRPIQTALAEHGWKLNALLITHHHHDHVAGLDLLKNIYKAKVYGPDRESNKIVNLDEKLSDGDSFTWAGRPINIIETPGHTMGHICYHMPDDDLIFTGDTLFMAGCGRLFEGTPKDMWASLSKLAKLPGKTKVYCGHEYTLSNAEFAIKLEPGNIDLQTRLIDIRKLRGTNSPTLPSTLDIEMRTNPFMRPDSREIRETLNLTTASDEEVFAAIRKRKDNS